MALQKLFSLEAKKKKGANHTNLKYNTPRDSQQNKMGSEALGVEKQKRSKRLLNITSELKT